jgi:hypothetical protein
VPRRGALNSLRHGPIVLTTKRGIADWGAIFDDTTVVAAILDPSSTTPASSSITGDSYRMRRHRDTINALQPALTGRATRGEFPWCAQTARALEDKGVDMT